MYINTNTSALFAQNALNNTSQQVGNLAQELATGYKINSPADNPSGLAISNLMTGELGGITSATANGNQGSNLLQTANGGIQNDMQIVQQVQQLAVQASNSTNSSQDQQDIQNQINQLLKQVNSNSTSINYNNQSLLNGSFGASASLASGASSAGVSGVALGPDGGSATAGTYSVVITAASNGVDTVTLTTASGATIGSTSVAVASGATTATAQIVQQGKNPLGSSLVVNFNPATIAGSTGSAATVAFNVKSAASPLSFQVGPGNSSADTINASLGSFTKNSLGLNNLSVVGSGSSTSGTSNAKNAIHLAKNALSMLTNAQGQVGAQMDQINYTLSNLQTESTNLQSSKATIKDANMAKVSSQFAQAQVLQQTGLQALSTDQQMPSMVLKLLQ